MCRERWRNEATPSGEAVNSAAKQLFTRSLDYCKMATHVHTHHARSWTELSLGELRQNVAVCVRTSCGVSCRSGSSVASRMAVCSGARPCDSDSSSTSSCVDPRRRTKASSSCVWFSSAASASAITCRREGSVKPGRRALHEPQLRPHL